ncbi:concanavalin A-like lectin/glucanase superfamily protein [Motilibacter peucedani]|uniref:non-reducing end alpha-L-arabinofuranosidase n=1 Tax=Motilibacter peucedani TaxID=598650 RepID=A0A420XQG7_9ACTN|nr:LamG-like jellyroll fold domain-containing protein [Motilibacter peucedani]RKS75495.1 concanavalin A-like lectin/glucanase superfamily protein [Motilibacter peucedani]
MPRPTRPPRSRSRRSVAALAVGSVLAGGLTAALGGPGVASAATGPSPLSRWTFEEGSGTTSADTVGTSPVSLQGGATWASGIQGQSALQLDGNGQFADAGEPVIDTGGSFTVSTWVKLVTVGGYQTVVSVDGAQVSGFFLGLRGDTNRFAFVQLPTDAAQGAPAFPGGSFDPVAGQWYQLTGVKDAAAGTLSLYVNGRLQATTAAPPSWSAGGHLVVGRGKYAGNPVDFVNGSVDDVRAWSSALTAGQVAQLATTGTWRFDEGSGTTAADDSLADATGTLTGGASWTPGVVGPSGVAFNGTSAYVDTPGPEVNTSQSFSVAAWVRADDPDGFRTAVSVDGDQVSGFFLQRRGDGRFAFTKLASDSTAAAASVASATTTASTGVWYHLVGVYDSVAGTVTLFVNGTKQSTVSVPSTWRATGHLVVGRGKYGGPADFWSGAVDDVRTYPFAMDAATASSLATSGQWHLDEGAGTLAKDSSPNGADGTLRGAGATWTTGAVGKAVALTGGADITVADSPGLDLGTGSASVNAWVRTTSSAPQTLLAKGTATDGYAIAVSGGKVTVRLGSGASAISGTTADGGLADGDWHDVVAVVDRSAGRLRVYLDGTASPLVPSAGSCGAGASDGLDISMCAGASGDSAASFTIGSASGSAPFLSGAVDEVQVVRYALTAEQVAVLAGANAITVDATDIRATTRKTTYGLILEDISHSVEGGLYAELVRNRSFKESYQGGSGAGDFPVPYWELSTAGGATGSYAVDRTTPLNSAIDRSLKFSVATLPVGGRIAASNVGFYGIEVDPSTSYKGSVSVKAASGWKGDVRVSLEKPDGTVVASKKLSGVGTAWNKRTFTLKTPSGIASSTDNRVVVSLVNSGKKPISGSAVWVSQVSLFPPTYKNHGLRVDLMEKLAALKPGLFRVPGGNYLEGNDLATHFDWKTTIGPVDERPGHQNTAWGYWSSDGMGILEYLEMAEDLGAQPDLALFAGYTLNGQHVSEADYQPYIDSALDEIEYAIGDTSTTWGAKRAADGHPKPFDLHYVEVGNEDWFDGSGSYAWRFSRMYDAIKAAYPQLKVISTTGGLQGGAASSTATGRTPDVADDHYYNSPQWFTDASTRYDQADRSGPQILVGEYGAQDGQPTGTLASAVGEAAFLTGLERNSDIVIGSMYAPILVNENQSNWGTNLIGLDAGSSYGSPSYWVEQMFSNNLGQHVVGSRITGAGVLRQTVSSTTTSKGTTFYVKLVNPSNQVQSARLRFTDVASIDGTGTLTQLTGDAATRNTLAAPEAVTPTTRQVTGLGTSTRLSLPANSVTVLRVTGR